MTPDQLLMIAGIRANPDDNVPRLAYADWLEENMPRGLVDGMGRVAKGLQDALGDGLCLECGEPWDDKDASRHLHKAGCPVRDLWRAAEAIRTDPAFPVQDRDAATAEFIRLTCGTKYKERDRNGRELPLSKDAAGWIKANWRRLLPALFRDSAEAIRIQEEAEAAWVRRHRRRQLDMMGRPMSVAEYLSAPDNPPVHREWQYWESTRHVICRVLVVTNDEMEGARVWPCNVQMIFARGFVRRARWVAPVLGKKIAQRVHRDQPLAVLDGPHAARFVSLPEV